jgi:hypothetical protein
MARIAGVSVRGTGLRVKLVYFFTQLVELTHHIALEIAYCR